MVIYRPSKSPGVDWWERAKTSSGIVAAIIIPVVVLVVGNRYSAAIKERELEGKFVELAVSILKEQPDKQSRSLRDWATQVITRYSGVPLSEEAKKELIETTPLPGGSLAVRDVQAMLAELGYYSGPVDGIIGPALRLSVSKFQSDNKLSADGIMGPQTVNLMIEKYNAVRQSKR